MKTQLKMSNLLSMKVRIYLYIFSLSTLLFSQNYCINVCPFIDSITNSELVFNLFIIFLIHIIVREILYRVFNTPFKNLTLPRHAYYLSIISWMIAGIAAFILHFFKYPTFQIVSHIKLLSSYWILGAAILSQLEYILFEKRFKEIATNVDISKYNENISRRIVESFIILTVAPAITIFLILARYYHDNVFNNSHIIQEIGYVIALFVITAIASSLLFSKMLKKDTKMILKNIKSIQNGNYQINIDITRADELGEISNAIEHMATKIDSLNREIVSTQMEVVNKMGEIAETRSKETGNHVKRVALYTEVLALKYGMSEQEVEILKQASPMHDIGKVGISDSILNKPGKLTKEEFEIMKKHTLLGHNILKESTGEVFQAATIIAKEHHEKFDGTGYPFGLKQEEIHIYGRITAIADVFDALGHDRVYKKAWDVEKILDLFQREKGKHFDPRLIELFFQHLDKFLEIKESLEDKYVH